MSLQFDEAHYHVGRGGLSTRRINTNQKLIFMTKYYKRIEDHQQSRGFVDETNQSKLPFSEDEVNALFDEEDLQKKSKIRPFSNSPIKGLVMPSLNTSKKAVKKSNIIYHDLGQLFPNANIANEGGFIIHRAKLIGINGIYQLFNWASDGDISVVDLRDVLGEDKILSEIITKLNEYIIGDLNGEILQLSETRLLVLPPSCRGMKGLEDEAFVL